MNAAAPLLLELADTAVSAREIALSVGGFQIRGQVSLEGAQLHLGGREGTVSATRLILRNVTVMGEGLRLGGQELVASNATVSWGNSGLHVRATSVNIQAIQIIGDHEPLDGTLKLEGIMLSELVVDGDEVHVAHARIAATQADAKLPARESGEASADPSSPASGSTSMLDRLLGVLDRLTGHVNVDLGLDLTVPVIGRRRATHHFRVPIDAGTIDYRRAEDQLSTLEDSLLDFSVRDEGLVLEVGIPFLPTRGKGKPIVTWSLDDADLALANDNRVRLSVLARPDRSEKTEEPDDGEEKSSPVSVRQAHLEGLDVKLAIASAEDSPIKSVGELTLAGDVTYATEEPAEGVLRGAAQNVELGAIGAGRFSVSGLRLDAASDVEVGFVGATPVRARLLATNLTFDGLHVAPREVDERLADTTGDGAGSGHSHSHSPHAPAK